MSAAPLLACDEQRRPHVVRVDAPHHDRRAPVDRTVPHAPGVVVPVVVLAATRGRARARATGHPPRSSSSASCREAPCRATRPRLRPVQRGPVTSSRSRRARLPGRAPDRRQSARTTVSASTDRSSGRRGLGRREHQRARRRRGTRRAGASPCGDEHGRQPEQREEHDQRGRRADPTATNSSGTSTVAPADGVEQLDGQCPPGSAARYSRRRSSTDAACAIPADTAASRNATTSVTIAPVTRSSMRIAPCGSCDVSTAVIAGRTASAPATNPASPSPPTTRHAARGSSSSRRAASSRAGVVARRSCDLAERAPSTHGPTALSVAKPTASAPTERADGRGPERPGGGADDHEGADPDDGDHRAQPRHARRRLPAGDARAARRSTRRSETAPDTAASSGTPTSATASALPADPQLGDGERGALERQQRAQRAAARRRASDAERPRRRAPATRSRRRSGRRPRAASRRAAAASPAGRRAGRRPAGPRHRRASAAARRAGRRRSTRGSRRRWRRRPGTPADRDARRGATKPSRPPTTLSVSAVVTANAVTASPVVDAARRGRPRAGAAGRARGRRSSRRPAAVDADDEPVPHLDAAVAPGGDLRVVRHDDERRARAPASSR